VFLVRGNDVKINYRKVCDKKLFPILMVLENLSDEVYIVGGAVRDLLMNKTPNDYDLVTDTPIETLKEEFFNSGFKVSLTGENFLVLNVHFDGYVVEVANFRKDVKCDGRHAEVRVGTILEDAERRDFTCNALFLNTRTSEILDPTGQGLIDSLGSILRFNGDPKKRIREDFLRVWRFYRFLNKGFTPCVKSLRAVRSLFNEAYENTTPERVRAEMEKMVL